MGRKAFGPSKKKRSDQHHIKKKKGEFSKASSSREGLRHSRVDLRSA